MANILDAFQENQDAKKAIDTSKKLKIGIIGTSATVRSGSYAQVIEALDVCITGKS